MTRLRLVTYNIAHGRGRDGRVDLRRTAATLRRLAADVVCLQEVDRYYGARSGWADQASELTAALGMTSAYGAAMTLAPVRTGAPDREYGNAVLTRLPRPAERPVAVHALPFRGRAEPRCLLLVELEALTVGCMHLQHDDADARARQVTAVLAALPPDRPVVLAGDFNADPDQPELAALREGLADAWPRAGRGRGATFPSGWPRRRLDHVHCGRGVQATQARVVASAASDHRPLVVDLLIDEVVDESASGSNPARPR